MADEDEHPSLAAYSEEVFESECFNCSQDGYHVEAEVYCVECEDNLCRSCLTDHNKIARLRTHQIQDKSSVKPGTTQRVINPPTEKCVQHHGRLLETYCASHDAVCCSACASLNHKSCDDMKYIPNVAPGTSNSKELHDAQTTTASVKTQLGSMKTKRNDTLDDVKKQRCEAIERVSEFEEKLIERIKALGKKTTDDIVDRYKKLEDEISNGLDDLHNIETALDASQKQLQAKVNNESTLFVHLKQSKQTLSNAKKLLATSNPNHGKDQFLFETDDSILNNLETLMTLGNFIEDSEYSAVHISDKNVNSSDDDEKFCDITGICTVDSGELIMTDWTNNCLKRFNKSLEMVSRCALPHKAWDVCQTNSTELALSLLEEQKIQFVSLGNKMSLTRSFTTSGVGNCTGIACKSGTLYVSRSNGGSSSSVQAYDMNGTLLQTLQNDTGGLPLFNRPRQIAVSECSSNVYIADYDNGLIILDKFGQLVTRVADTELVRAYGVCVLPGKQVLACGCDSNNVVQFNGQGRKIRTLLTDRDGMTTPETLYFDPSTSLLLVAMAQCNSIKVFRLTKK